MWRAGKIKIEIRTAKGLSSFQVRGFIKNDLSFGVVKTWTGDITWTLIHLKSKRMSPSCFPSRESVVTAAERFEPLGNWDAALENWLEFGEQVPFKDEARQVVLDCGGVTMHNLTPITAPRSERPQYLC